MLTVYMTRCSFRACDERVRVAIHPPESCEVFAVRFLPSDDLQWLRVDSILVCGRQQIRKPLPCESLAGIPAQEPLLPLFTLEPWQELSIDVQKLTKGDLREAIPFLMVKTQNIKQWEMLRDNPALR